MLLAGNLSLGELVGIFVICSLIMGALLWLFDIGLFPDDFKHPYLEDTKPTGSFSRSKETSLGGTCSNTQLPDGGIGCGNTGPDDWDLDKEIHYQNNSSID